MVGENKLTYLSILVGQLLRQLDNLLLWSGGEGEVEGLDEVLFLHLAVGVLVHQVGVILLHQL